MIVIRKARAADANSIQDLYRALVNNPQVRVLPERVEQLADAAATALLIAERDGDVVGTALVSFCADVMFQAQPFAVVENFIVNANCRKCGIGSALMREVEQYCLAVDCSKSMLLSSSERVVAHEFFTKAGFSGSVKQGFVKYRRQFSTSHDTGPD
ncbi:MAG TPA: GNAT family N-acetyltransferase [Rhodocyclaceae bacterium]|nr:GNAT family N-acetyltransferase [Rhodocyclaceae bacterium]